MTPYLAHQGSKIQPESNISQKFVVFEKGDFRVYVNESSMLIRVLSGRETGPEIAQNLSGVQIEVLPQ